MTCVICQQRPADHPQVCGPCRTRAAALPTDIATLAAQLPSVLTPGTGAGQRVSGTPAPPVPVALDPLDLLGPARGGAVHDEHGDQTGYVSVATTLDGWVRDWAEQRNEGLPRPAVARLAQWLRDRTDWACDRHPAIDEYASELGRLRATLRRVLGQDERPVRLPAPCPDCDTMTLVKHNGADHVECWRCHRLWTEPEYQRLAVVLASGLEAAQ